jgi:uncharacterized protein (DUF58 family)
MLKSYIKKWVMLFIIIPFSLVIGIRTSIVFFHFFFWFLVMVVAINLAWLITIYFGVRLVLTRESVLKVIEDDFLNIEAKVRNKTILPAFNVVLQDELTCADPRERTKIMLIEYLAPRSSVSLRYRCFCPLRGRYNNGPFTVYFFDPFGIFFLKRTFYTYSELYVYPRYFTIKRFPNLVKGFLPWFGIETTRVSGDEDEFFGIREYKEGDPIKRIHWISTARKMRLIVKQYQRQSFFKATIIFSLEKDKNYGEGKERVAEYIIKIAASVAKYLIERGISVELIAHAGEIVHMPYNKGPEHLENILKFLATAQAESRANLGETFEEFSRYIPNDSNLIAIMPDTDQEYLQSMLLLEHKNVYIIPLILISSTFVYLSEKQKALREAGIRISPASKLKPMFFARGDNLEEAFLR